MVPDYYDRLGLPRDASLEQIKSAYRRLSLAHHPDRTGRPDHDEFLRVKEAYETLSDPERRAAYDRRLSPPRPGRHGRAVVEELQYPAGSSVAVDLEVILAPGEAIRGGRLSLAIPVSVACRVCRGTGQSGFWICPVCDGQGTVLAAARVQVLLPGRLRDGAVVPVLLRDAALGGVLVRLHIRVEA